MDWKSMMKLGVMTMGLGFLAACGKTESTTSVQKQTTQSQTQAKEEATTTQVATD